MNFRNLPQRALEALLQDAAERDPTTRRRAALFQILLYERYLTYPQLVVRVEGLVGKGCFGHYSAEDVFYRDMRIVKRAFEATNYRLCYSRNRRQPGYYLAGQPTIAPELVLLLRQSEAETDKAQIRILAKMTPAERFRIGCSITDTARNAVAFRVKERNPALNLTQASFFAVHKRLPS